MRKTGGKCNKNKVVMKTLTKEVKAQYLPPKIKEKQIIDNPEKFEKIENDKKVKNYSSQLEYSGGVSEYVEMAKLAKKQYVPLEEHATVQNMCLDNQEVKFNQFHKILLENITKNDKKEINYIELLKNLQIPKRPKYIKGMKPKEFESLENNSFLEWRRSLSEVETKNEQFAISPYEKNVNVWRQLWLTMEKCQLLIQIVDARNPLFFRSEDLENYIKEISDSKVYLLLINKADLLTEEVRLSWADYFKNKGIKFMFFSALIEDTLLQEEDNKNKENLDVDDEVDEEDNMFKIKDENYEERLKEHKNLLKNNKKNKKKIDKDIEESEIVDNQESKKKEKDEKIEELKNETKDLIKEFRVQYYSEISSNEYKVYSRSELIAELKRLVPLKDKKIEYNTIGFIGYPNVGKSSVINVLMKKKKVGVALMPGKTKHLQTLFLPEDNTLCLMDCPGLVFPTFSFSKADLVINGIMPIDKITDYLNPVQLIIYNIPKHKLEQRYKIKLPEIYSATQFLQIAADKHGFLTGRAIPNEAKMARIVLKDYIGGQLLFCYLRPDYDRSIHGSQVLNYLIDESVKENESIEVKYNEHLKRNEILKQIPSNFDDNYEKIGLDNNDLNQINKNFQDVDDFLLDNKVDESNIRIPKDVRMQLKFAMKRGEITEEEYENAFSMEDAKALLNQGVKEKIKTNKITDSKQL